MQERLFGNADKMRIAFLAQFYLDQLSAKQHTNNSWLNLCRKNVQMHLCTQTIVWAHIFVSKAPFPWFCQFLSEVHVIQATLHHQRFLGWVHYFFLSKCSNSCWKLCGMRGTVLNHPDVQGSTVFSPSVLEVMWHARHTGTQVCKACWKDIQSVGAVARGRKSMTWRNWKDWSRLYWDGRRCDFCVSYWTRHILLVAST